MKFNWISSVAAIALLATIGCAYADTITASTVGATPPVGFTLLNLGTDMSAGYVGDANSTITDPDSSFDNISSITFSGGSGSGSGVYSGSTGTSASPFNVGLECTSNCSQENYLVAESATTVGNKSVPGTVTVDFSTEQQTLDLLWGTVDTAANYNDITFYNCNTGFQTCTQVANSAVDGSDIGALNSQIADNSGDYNAWVTIANLGSSDSNFNQVVFSDGTNSPAFEFAIAEDPPAPVPEPSSLAIFVAGLAGLVSFAAVRRRKVALAF
jgi:PEP-CTERM motif